MVKEKNLEERIKIITKKCNQEVALARLQNRLRILFEMAYKGLLSTEELYEKGRVLEEEIAHVHPNFWDDKKYPKLKDALEFIDELHDPSTREYNEKNKEQIYYHMRQLSN